MPPVRIEIHLEIKPGLLIHLRQAAEYFCPKLLLECLPTTYDYTQINYAGHFQQKIRYSMFHFLLFQTPLQVITLLSFSRHIIQAIEYK